MTMGYAALIKCALWCLLIVAFSLILWRMAATIHDNIYNDGRLAERVVWQKKESDRQDKLAHEISEAVNRLNAERDKQVSALTGALDYANKAKDKLNRDLNDVRAANRGLWINAEKCNDSGGKDEDSAINSSGPGRIRLPSEIEQNLWELVADAQEVVIQYETCRKTLLPLVEVNTN